MPPYRNVLTGGNGLWQPRPSMCPFNDRKKKHTMIQKAFGSDVFTLLIQHLCTRDTCMLSATCRQFRDLWHGELDRFRKCFFSDFQPIMNLQPPDTFILAQLFAETRDEFNSKEEGNFLITIDIDTACHRWAGRIGYSRSRTAHAITRVLRDKIDIYYSFFQTRKRRVDSLLRIQEIFGESPELMAAVSKKNNVFPELMTDNDFFTLSSSLWPVIHQRRASDWYQPSVGCNHFDAENIVNQVFHWLSDEMRQRASSYLFMMFSDNAKNMKSYKELCEEFKDTDSALRRGSKRARKIMSTAAASSSGKRRRTKKK